MIEWCVEPFVRLSVGMVSIEVSTVTRDRAAMTTEEDEYGDAGATIERERERKTRILVQT